MSDAVGVDDVGQPDLSLGDRAGPGGDALDPPQLLGAAPMDGSAGRGEHPLAGRAQEVGVVVDADDVALVPQPGGPGDAGDGFDDRAVDAAVHDAVGLMLRRGDRPAGPHEIGSDLGELEAERRAESAVVEGRHRLGVAQQFRIVGGLVAHAHSCSCREVIGHRSGWPSNDGRTWWFMGGRAGARGGLRCVQAHLSRKRSAGASVNASSPIARPTNVPSMQPVPGAELRRGQEPIAVRQARRPLLRTSHRRQEDVGSHNGVSSVEGQTLEHGREARSRKLRRIPGSNSPSLPRSVTMPARPGMWMVSRSTGRQVLMLV